MPLRRFLIKTWKVLASHSVLRACKPQHPLITTGTLWTPHAEVLCASKSLITLAKLPWDDALSQYPQLAPAFHSTPLLSLHILWLCLSWAWFDQRGKMGESRGSVNNLWELPPRNWGIMICILVPLLCHFLPRCQGGLCNWERLRQSNYSGQRGCVFPQRHEGGGVFPLGQKQRKKDNKKK